MVIDKEDLKMCQKRFFDAHDEIIKKKNLNDTETERLNNLLSLWRNIENIKSDIELYNIKNNHYYLKELLQKNENCPKYRKYISKFKW